MPLDPALAARMPLLEGLTHEDRLHPTPEVQARLERFDAPFGPYAPPVVDVRESAAAGPHGDVPVRIYTPPERTEPGPGLVWMHGGAFMFGDLDMPEADNVGRELCARAGATVVSVDYRLATGGVHFPVPHDDVVAAWRWTVGAAAELGIDPGRLALGGGSAGGNLAAGVALRLRDQGGATPSRLLLAYPALHEELPPPSPELERLLGEIPAVLRFPPAITEMVNSNYVGAGLTATPYAFPALGDVTGLPPTLIVTSEYDDLRTSAEAFAEQLAAAGVDIEVVCEPGVVHGHLNVEGLPATDRSLAVLAAALMAEAATPAVRA